MSFKVFKASEDLQEPTWVDYWNYWDFYVRDTTQEMPERAICVFFENSEYLTLPYNDHALGLQSVSISEKYYSLFIKHLPVHYDWNKQIVIIDPSKVTLFLVCPNVSYSDLFFIKAGQALCRYLPLQLINLLLSYSTPILDLQEGMRPNVEELESTPCRMQ